MDHNETTQEAIEIPEPTATAAKTKTDSRRSAPLDLVAKKHADAVKAKKKKKRDPHRVALRRSHTKG